MILYEKMPIIYNQLEFLIKRVNLLKEFLFIKRELTSLNKKRKNL